MVHTYRLNGSQIIAEEWTATDDYGTTAEHMILFLYDAEGAPIGMQYRNQTYAPEIFDVYWFEKNLQGDVVAVYDAGGTKLISYTYDAWGNFTTTYHNGNAATSTANYNPFRYRSYYYDAELEMYYLKSRYYDPEICRFINADDISCLSANGDFASYNLYAYCGNNPVSRKDDGGKFWHIVAGAALGGILAGVATAISCVANGDDLEKAVGKILVSTACGAIGGALAATGIGVAGQMIIGGVLGAAESAANQMIDTGSIDPVELGIATVSGVVGGFTGGNGAAHGKNS